MHLGEEIRVKREAMGLSLEELAHQLGVPSWKVANWEVGVSKRGTIKKFNGYFRKIRGRRCSPITYFGSELHLYAALLICLRYCVNIDRFLVVDGHLSRQKGPLGDLFEMNLLLG